MAIKLRLASDEDAPFLLDVYASARAEELSQVPWSNEQKEVFLRSQFDAQQSFYQKQYPEATYCIILQDGKPVGRLYVLRAENLIRILDITVLSQFRNAGVGTSLIRELIAEGAQRRQSVHIWVEYYNPSMRLFERLGFSRIQEEGINWLMERPVK